MSLSNLYAYMKLDGKVFLWLFVPGATIGSALDAFHVRSGIERYAVPAFLGIAWWVPLLLGTAAVAIGYSHPLLDPLLGQAPRPHPLPVSVAGLSWLLLAYLISATALLSIEKVVLLCTIYLNFWLLAGRSWQNLLLSVITAITGTLIEMLLVAAGAFSYVHPDFIGVPYWLPCMYACASLALGNLGRSFISSSTRGIT
jgi:hypothetical protein